MSPVGFREFAFSDGDIEHGVFRNGDGPGVVIMHGLPGVTEAYIDFAKQFGWFKQVIICPATVLARPLDIELH